MDGGAAFVGALAAGLGAVAAGAADFAVVGQAAAAPGAVAGFAAGSFDEWLVGGHVGIMPRGCWWCVSGSPVGGHAFAMWGVHTRICDW